MYTKIFLATCAILAVTSAYDLVQDGEGREFYLVPLNRQRRQTNIGLSPENSGFRATVSHQGNILDRNGHRLDGGGFVSKPFRPSGPATVGGNLGYSHNPSGSNLNVGAQRTPGYGTDLSASGTGNVWRNGNSRLDAVGRYDRHFGGPGGTGRPNYYGGLQFNHRF